MEKFLDQFVHYLCSRCLTNVPHHTENQAQPLAVKRKIPKLREQLAVGTINSICQLENAVTENIASVKAGACTRAAPVPNVPTVDTWPVNIVKVTILQKASI